MTFKRGSVVLVHFPNSDLKTVKKRPALVVQNHAVNTNLDQTIVAMITTNLERTGLTRVKVKTTDPTCQAMGLRTDSIVVTDNLATIKTREIYKVIGECTIMPQIEAALKFTFGLQ
ncbi:MAG: type II toxin-antitoxin system PemK/MazF family toxin [Candidatus Cloacimonetes bacterium]|nr:type II toxin-antitoxin system PemK/MazF family toxin [Candidatus Cloacimonadota bacterium]